MDVATAYLTGLKTAMLTGRDLCAQDDPGGNVAGAGNRATAACSPVR